MSNTIDQYREAKATYQKLHNQAKKELVVRFNQLAVELFQIQRELKEDFGHKVTIPTKSKSARASRTAPPKPADEGQQCAARRSYSYRSSLQHRVTEGGHQQMGTVLMLAGVRW